MQQDLNTPLWSSPAQDSIQIGNLRRPQASLMSPRTQYVVLNLVGEAAQRAAQLHRSTRLGAHLVGAPLKDHQATHPVDLLSGWLMLSATWCVQAATQPLYPAQVAGMLERLGLSVVPETFGLLTEQLDVERLRTQPLNQITGDFYSVSPFYECRVTLSPEMLPADLTQLLQRLRSPDAQALGIRYVERLALMLWSNDL